MIFRAINPVATRTPADPVQSRYVMPEPLPLRQLNPRAWRLLTAYSRDVTAPLWVAKLIISQKKGAKLAGRHGVDWQEVRDAIVCVTGLLYVWDDNPERGRRALVDVEIRGIRCVVVLYPVDDPDGDVYALGSAYPR